MPKLIKTKLLLLALSCFLLSIKAQADTFRVDSIELVGAKRITLATVLSYLPVSEGDVLTPALTRDVMRALYNTEFFRDISLSRRDNVLVVEVKERPAIAEINFDGNSKVKTQDITEAFENVDLVRGRIYNDLVLDKMQQELERVYYSVGRYGVKMDTQVTPLPRNRVKIDIDIKEGLSSKIRKINIVGNKSFSDKEILKRFEQGVPKWWQFFSGKDQYAKQKIAGDLETLESFYLNRGYANFRLVSALVTMSPDKKDIYITLNIEEGDKYRVRDISISGELGVPRPGLLTVAGAFNPKGSYFSNGNANAVVEQIKQQLGNVGYAFAEVDVKKIIDDATKEVDLDFIVDQGQRVYVRRILFDGNDKTREHVYRRELRQLEGAWYSDPLVERSKVRVQRLRYVDEVEIEKLNVPGRDDQVDIVYKVKERLAGSFNIGAGFSGDNGVALSGSLTQENLFGTGESLSISVSENDVVTRLSASHVKPYVTKSGVTRALNFSMSEVDTEETSFTNFITNTRSVGVNYRWPVSEYSIVGIGADVDNVDIKLSDFSNTGSFEVDGFIDGDSAFEGDGNGSEYDQLSLNLLYSYDTRNRSIFPDRGIRQSVSLALELPGSDLEYFKLRYNGDYYWPVTRNTTLNLSYTIGIGNGYRDLDGLPFYENFVAGGINSLRGFESRSIGPRENRFLYAVPDIDPDTGEQRIVEGQPSFIAARRNTADVLRVTEGVEGSGAIFPGQQFISIPDLLEVNRRTVGGELMTLATLEYILPPVGGQRLTRFSFFYEAGGVFEDIDSFEPDEIRSSVGITFRWFAPVGPMVFSYAVPLEEQPGDETEEFQFTVGGSF